VVKEAEPCVAFPAGPAFCSREHRMIAVVDDDPSVRDAVANLIASRGLPVSSYSSAEQFLALGDFDSVTCVVTDIQMPGMSGMELRRYLRATCCSVPVILMTAYFDESGQREAMGTGAAAYLVKPFSGEALISEIDRALALREAP
jgi:FixJ family two-component response regulator